VYMKDKYGFAWRNFNETKTVIIIVVLVILADVIMV